MSKCCAGLQITIWAYWEREGRQEGQISPRFYILFDIPCVQSFMNCVVEVCNFHEIQQIMQYYSLMQASLLLTVWPAQTS